MICQWWGKLQEVASVLKHMHDAMVPHSLHVYIRVYMHDDDAASCMEKSSIDSQHKKNTLKYLPVRILFRHFVRLQIFGFLQIVSVMCCVGMFSKYAI